MPGEVWPWKYTRSPPCSSVSPCQKWFWPQPIMVASEANEAIWPPRSPPSGGLCLLARTTIAMAFQRTYERMRASSSRLPGWAGSSPGGIVFT
ncbi:Uncharacterised protein [Bordetella pertussis]|nr:Uncharacterised protein [Bordetella pertussis]